MGLVHTTLTLPNWNSSRTSAGEETSTRSMLSSVAGILTLPHHQVGLRWSWAPPAVFTKT